MCGFAAVVSLGGEKPDLRLISRMTGFLTHRGPDDDGMIAEGGYVVGFRRLAILDLAPSGHQPMLSSDGRHVIVFNGEIYNYVELRDELITLGHVVRSSGDTEVLLAAFREWGEQCLGRLNGLWAFLIYHRISRHLFGARDRFRVKRLYIYRDARFLMYSSEIRAIRDSSAVRLLPDWQTIAHFLLDDQLEDSERTFYTGVEQVAAGTAFEADADGRMRSWRYWSLPSVNGAVPNPVETYREVFDDAVRLRMRSDVSVGVQLSGGLDATSIISRMAQHWAAAGRDPQDLQAFSYLSPEFDEEEQIQATLQQTNASQVPLAAGPGELWSTVEKHLWFQDEPVHSFTSVVGFGLMGLARSHNVKVLLNGQGADEALVGYSNYFFDYWSDLVRAGRLWAANSEISWFASAHRRERCEIGLQLMGRSTRQAMGSLPGYAALARMRGRHDVRADPWVSDEFKNCWSAPPNQSGSSRDAVLRRSVEASPLPLYLRVEDRNSMVHGVEVRLPFLDYRLVNLAFSLGSEWKLKGPYTKRLLREAMRGQIPEIVRTRVHKFGFPTSVESWLRGPLYEPLRDLLTSRLVRESDLWNNSAVTAALEQHRTGAANHGARLFDVAQLCLWMESSRNWPNGAAALTTDGRTSVQGIA